jgi:hypothetical protein
MAFVCEKECEFGQRPPPLFIGQAQGVEDTWKYQNALKGGFPNKPIGKIPKRPQGGFPRSHQKVLFTIHENIFPRPLNPKIFL